jgi:hypothetical protein
MEMHNAGKSVREIRAAIEATYRHQFGTITPTSPPPKDKEDKKVKVKGKR